MNIARNLLALFVLGSLTASSIGQESQQPAPAEQQRPPTQAPPPAGAPAQTPPAATPPAAGPAAGAQPAPAPRMPVVKDEEFIPTQEIQGDEEVTFPVDI